MNGLPGPYIKFFLRELGHEGTFHHFHHTLPLLHILVPSEYNMTPYLTKKKPPIKISTKINSIHHVIIFATFLCVPHWRVSCPPLPPAAAFVHGISPAPHC